MRCGYCGGLLDVDTSQVVIKKEGTNEEIQPRYIAKCTVCKREGYVWEMDYLIEKKLNQMLEAALNEEGE